MKKILSAAALVSVMLLASCTSTPGALYRWYGYPAAASDYAKNPEDSRLKALLSQYEKIMAGQETALRQEVPPGLCADYGFMLIQAGRTAEGMELLDREVQLYPESEILVQKLVSKIRKED